MQIRENCVVSIHYTLTNGAGDQLDSSSDQDPFTYLHGSRGIIPGLEKALEGKSPGDEFQVTIPPAEAYGEVNEGLIQSIPREAFAGIEQLEPGMQFQTRDPNGQTLNITVREVAEDNVKIDANHPLAGQALHFDVSITGVREATDEEIAHGHVHP